MAPTKLGNFGYRRFDYRGQGSRSLGAQRGSPQVAWLHGPWPGWEPDIDDSSADAGAAALCSNVIDREGVLTHQNGFSRIDSTRLPLGDTTPPAIAADAEPVVGLFQGITNATQAYRRYALTADTSGNGRGHFYELVSGVWTHRAFGGGGGTPGGEAYTGESDPGATLADFAHFGAGDYTVFSSGAKGRGLAAGSYLYRFPGVAAATDYELLPNVGVVTLDANSLLSSEERIHAFGTTENGTYFPGRWAWTSKGANAQFDRTVTGAGFADLNEFGGEGLCVRNIGPKIALYLDTGVQFARRTGQATDPFAKDYAVYGRGLLGTHALCEVGENVHFGIFTDGWFLLNSAGQWEERGKAQRSGYKKWHREFYGTLDWSNRKRIICQYDAVSRWIYIGFPQAGVAGNAPSTVWIYDLDLDTVWPAPDYANMPNSFGTYTEETVAGLRWSDITTPWTGTPGSWASYESQVGTRRLIHGTELGLVMIHSPSVVVRDGILPTCSYRLKHLAGTRPDQFRKVDAAYVEYTSLAGVGGLTPAPLSLAYQSESGKLVSGTVSHAKGLANTKQIDFVSGAVSGLNHNLTVSGQAPLKISGLGLQVYEEGTEVRKDGAT